MSLKGKGPVHHLNRSRKAKMIEAFLEDELGGDIDGYRMLDIGCGNGQISNFFSQRNDVSGVDVEDKRTEESTDYDYQLINDETLPFADHTFDIIISHHVIEHVADQIAHLSEINRTLKPQGLAYLGCPNKGSPFMAGHVGNDSVLTRQKAEELFAMTGFKWQETYTKFLSQPRRYHCELSIGQFIPEFAIKLLRPWYPSHCYILRRP